MSTNANTVKNYRNKIASNYLDKFYLDTESTDVNFTFQSDSTQSVPAHKVLLSAKSNVFKAMFFGESKEKGDVKVVGVTADAFRVFLQFFYLCEVQLTIENIADVMSLGHKYNVSDCFDSFVLFLKETLSSDNACLSYSLAILYDIDELKELCKKKIEMDSQAVFKSKYYLEADRRTFTDILNMDSLSCSEIDVFKACVASAEAVSNQNNLTTDFRHTLRDLFQYIRFASMKIEEFCKLNLSYGDVFTLTEFKDITQMIVLRPDYTSTMFNNKLRHVQSNNTTEIICNRILPGTPYDSLSIETAPKTAFSTNKPVKLERFTCAKVFMNDKELESKLPAQIRIVECSSGIPGIVSRFTASLECKSETIIPLPRPVLARPECQYEIRIEMNKMINRFQHQYLKAVVEIDPDTLITFQSDHFVDGKMFGLITALEFQKN